MLKCFLLIIYAIQQYHLIFLALKELTSEAVIINLAAPSTWQAGTFDLNLTGTGN